MSIQQLRFLVRVVDSGLNVAEAAATLSASPSSHSTQICLLEAGGRA